MKNEGDVLLRCKSITVGLKYLLHRTGQTMMRMAHLRDMRRQFSLVVLRCRAVYAHACRTCVCHVRNQSLTNVSLHSKFTLTFTSAFFLEVITLVPSMLGSLNLVCCLPRPKTSTLLELPLDHLLGGVRDEIV